MKKYYDEIMNYVKGELSCSAHNMDHVMRVYKTAVKIAETEENVDMEVLVPSALLHDIARVKESNDVTGKIDHSVLGAQMASEYLESIDYPAEKIKMVEHCINTHRYRSGNIPESIEAKILFDADKLDAIGAVGIARCLMLSGQHGQRLMVTEDMDLYNKENIVENGRIKNLSSHTPIIEYETKLKNIPKKLYTDSAKRISKSRMELMNNFFEVLKKEIQ